MKNIIDFLKCGCNNEDKPIGQATKVAEGGSYEKHQKVSGCFSGGCNDTVYGSLFIFQ